MSALTSVAPGATTVAEKMTPRALSALAITSVAVLMVTLDNLVVTTAILVIRLDLHASLSGLQWVAKPLIPPQMPNASPRRRAGTAALDHLAQRPDRAAARAAQARSAD
jgi:hypothetical protein